MKNREIERKWLVNEKDLPNLTKMPYMDITQGYINSTDSKLTFRLRQTLYMTNNKDSMGEEFTMTIKGQGFKEREERESVIWKPQFSTFWPLCQDHTIHKHRYEYTGKNDEIIEIDVYKNEFDGLFTIEVEFDNIKECDAYIAEDWFGREVTENAEYTNFYMAVNKNKPVLV